MNTKKLHAGAVFGLLPVTNLDGETIDISKPTGGADWKMVVVYRGRHCPLCTKFLNSLALYRQRLLDIGTDIAAVVRALVLSRGRGVTLVQLVNKNRMATRHSPALKRLFSVLGCVKSL